MWSSEATGTVGRIASLKRRRMFLLWARLATRRRRSGRRRDVVRRTSRYLVALGGVPRHAWHNGMLPHRDRGALKRYKVRAPPKQSRQRRATRSARGKAPCNAFVQAYQAHFFTQHT